MGQMVRNEIACNCIPIVRIAFRYAHISFYLLFLRILIAYLRKDTAYLGYCLACYSRAGPLVPASDIFTSPGLEVIKLEFILKLKIKHNDWLLVDTCPQATNHCALF